MTSAQRRVHVDGVWMPTLVYGTAWKEERTADLVRQALDAGFRGIDTANQRRHYHEAAVGQALRDAVDAGTVTRDQVFLQTKFTYVAGQDHRLPYDSDAPVADQVRQSFESSLEHLGVERIDAYLLHGPSTYPGLGAADWEAWRAMEELHGSGRAHLLGVSNATIEQVRELWDQAHVKPTVVQNRTWTRPGADADVRAFCARHGILYEGFSLLTAVRGLLEHPVVQDTARQLGATPAQVVLGACLKLGMVVLTGTTDRTHMEQDLALPDLPLDPETANHIDALVRRVVPA